LKKKYDAFQTFKNFHAWIENDTQSHIGSSRTDNGKEYTSNEFETIFTNMGSNIKRPCFVIPKKME